MNLLFHDLEKSSGFQGRKAQKYKIQPYKFFKIISIFRAMNKKNRPIITFDDGGDSINVELIKKLINDFQVIVFIATKYINKAGFLETKEIIEMHQMGAVIGCHSHNHEDMRHYSQNEFKDDWNTSRKILEDLLCTKINYCSIPFGKFLKWQIRKLSSMGFERIYTSDNYSIKFSENHSTFPRIPIDSRILLLEIYLLKILGIRYLFFRANTINVIKKWI